MEYEGRVQVTTPLPFSVENRAFANSCLDLGRPNESCLQSQTPGKVVKLTFGGSFEPGKRFTLAARIEEPGEGEALTLELPPGLALVEGAETQPVPAAGPDGSATLLWKGSALRTGTFTVRVRSGRGAVYTRTLTVTPADPKG